MRAINLTETNFFDHIQSGVALVDFGAPWCGPCRMQAPIIDELAEQFEGRALLAKVNVDDQTELANQFGVRGIPALFLFKDGKLVDRMTGLTAKDQLKAKITELL